tara:strand:- start:1296 stop:1703 length:408 start_codon:yes stop_codon:yes gene_type:complete
MRDKLVAAYLKTVEGWRGAAPDDVQFTSSAFAEDFTRRAMDLLDGNHEFYVDDMYEILRAAYTSEPEVSFAIDRAGKFFDRKISLLIERDGRYTSFQHRKAVFAACNKALNSDATNRKMQILVVLVSYELWRLSS